MEELKMLKLANVYFLKEHNMKNIIYFLVSILLLISCKEKPVSKPEKIIDKETMTNILYDIAVLQASISYKPNVVNENIEVDKYIYEKYNIDSITLLQNQRYYASDVESFKKMYKSISERIKEEEVITDSLSKTEKENLKNSNPKKSPKPILE